VSGTYTVSKQTNKQTADSQHAHGMSVPLTFLTAKFPVLTET